MTSTIRPKSRLILVHGVGLQSAAWQAMTPYLQDRFTLQAIDLPSHGASTLPPLQSLDELAALITTKLQAEPAFVAGHSLGALAVLRLLAQSRDGLLGAIAINPVYGRSEAARQAVLARAKSLREGVNDPGPTLDRWFGEAYPEARLQTLRWLLARPEGYQAAYKVFAEQRDESEADLRRARTPALIITGERDANSTPEMATRLGEILPHAQSHVIKDAGHMGIMTHPREFAVPICAFAREVHHD